MSLQTIMTYMAIKLRVLLFFLFFLNIFINSVFADEGNYQSAVGFSRFTVSEEYGNYTEHSLSGYYYLQEIKIGGKPLSLAAYLQRASRIRVNYYQANYSSVPNLDQDRTGYSISYYEADIKSPYTFSFGYSARDTSYISRFRGHVGDVNRKYFILAFGYYIEQNTHINLGYQKYQADPTGVSLSYDSSNRYTLTATKMILTSNSSAWDIDGYISQVDYSSNETNINAGVDVGYSFNTNYRIGFELDSYSGDRESVNGNRFEITGSFFLTPNFNLSMEVAKFQSDDQAIRSDEDILNFSFVIRM